ncbi:putative damage-inducible protein DinB [Neorhizobium galegae]|uniref:DinB family protein n=1 Tax=Neorhizobium galegae TaxID=399 RepID=UPI001AE19F0E|nr:DinB family protein [Neorhizobium galegae]MBP2547364.1 putative damage-inducible protein DinB [Neorhizobium galegae]
MPDHFRMFADYNRWANARLYEACATLSDAEFRADKGAFFRSAAGTLNHLLVADRIWLRRFTGQGSAPTSLDAPLYETFADLRAARAIEDQRIIDWVDTLSGADLAATISYSPVSMPGKVELPLGPLLSHVFNHQTHHRGQVHTILTALGQPSLTLDLVYFLLGDGKRWQ